MSVDAFVRSLEERANEREESMLRGISVEPLLVMYDGLQLMDGYTRYTVLRKYNQTAVYVYIGTVT